jgi:hypothetical protein
VTETQLQNSIIVALRQMGVWCFVMNVTVRRGKRGVNCGEPGMPDIWTEYGWLEVKIPGNNLDQDQVAWHKRARSRGIEVETTCSMEQSVRIAQEWRQRALTSVLTRRRLA